MKTFFSLFLYCLLPTNCICPVKVCSARNAHIQADITPIYLLGNLPTFRENPPFTSTDCTRSVRAHSRARRQGRRSPDAQRTAARQRRARGNPVRGQPPPGEAPRGGPGEPQRPRFALPRLLRHSAYSPIFPAKFLFAEGMRRCCAKFSFLWISF